ncbi:MAG: hypothetical protein J6R34_00100 [Clostridia bacterium]|nr:hypothetical protein [Clostridia bacterium]
MAKENKKFNKNLAFMFIVPVLVIVVTMSIMGVTFAWFTHAEQTTIASLNLSTSQTFQMTFEIAANTKLDEYEQPYVYNGQTAFDENGLLVTEVHALEQKHYDRNSEQWQKYMNDQAFVAPFVLTLDTNRYAQDGKTIEKQHAVDFNCVIETVSIRNEKNPGIAINLPNNNGTPDDTTDDISSEDIKLGFTWYISGGPQGQLYTPYGRIYSTTPTSSQYAGTILGENGKGYDWLTQRPTVGFNSAQEGSQQGFTFNIVFAPEILYWKQYGSNQVVTDSTSGVPEYNETARDIYGDVFQSAKWNAINRYSAIVYSGSTYSFTVLLTVTTVSEVA